MVFLNSDSNSETAKPRNLLILQKLKQARAEQEAQNGETSSPNTQDVSKKFANKKPSKLEISSGSSSSSQIDKLKLIKRTTLQEKLFAAQCERSRQHFKQHRQMVSESESSTNSIIKTQKCEKSKVQGNFKHKFQKYNGHNSNNNNNNKKNNNIHCDGADNDDGYDDDVNYGSDEGNESDVCNKTGVLHLKKPLQLTDNEDMSYFKGNNRMKPIDWSLINGETNEEKKKTYKKIDNNTSSAKVTEQFSDALPIDDTDFINFVNNSTTNDTVYRVRNTLKETIKNANESPILKIQKAIKFCKADSITVTPEIRESFEPSQQEVKIIDLIDKVDKKSTSSLHNKPPQRSGLYNLKNNVNSAMQKIQKRNIEEFKRNQLQEVKSESLNNVDNSNRVVKVKKMIEEYSDDQIGFIKPSTSSSLTSCENPDKISDNDENSDAIYKKLIEKFKTSRNSRVHDISLDSDDVSTERSSELDDLSVTRRSSISKYESLKKRLYSSVSTQTSPEKKRIDFNKNPLIKNIKIKMVKDEEEPLIKESHTRYLNKPSNIILDNTAIVETEENISKEEPLLKPVSTRYFSALPKKEEIFNEGKSELIIEENIIQTTENDSINICNKESITKDVNGDIEKIISDSKEIKEIYKDNYSTSSLSEASILNVADNKTANDKSNNTNTSSSYEKKDSEENSKFDKHSDMQIQPSLNNLANNFEEENNIAGYEDINPDEEYDIVNCEQFFAYTSLLNKLQAVAAAQKEHALGIANELNNNDNDKNDSQNHSKAIESSLDSSENHFSSINASVSSNLESDNENSSNSSSSSSLILPNKNVFENVEINVEHLNNFQFNDKVPNATKLNESVSANQKTEMSARQKKKANALKNYLASKSAGGEKEEAEKNEDAVKNESLRAKESQKRNQILEEIKKRKLHLNCKAWAEENLN